MTIAQRDSGLISNRKMREWSWGNLTLEICFYWEHVFLGWPKLLQRLLVVKTVCCDGSSAGGFMGCGLKQSRLESCLEDAWGGEEVEAQASLAGRDPAATSSPGSLGLVSSGPGREASGSPWAPLEVTGTTVTIQGNIQGKRSSPLRRSSLGKGGHVSEAAVWTPWVSAEVLGPLMHQACSSEKPGQYLV